MHAHLTFTGFLGKHLHLGVTGSVAAYKALELVRLWRAAGVRVSATLTKSAKKFVTPLSFSALGADPVHTGMFPSGQNPAQNVFAHLEPGNKADAFVIAPATANCLAKLAFGLADDMLSCQALAFPKPLVVAPAMNPGLWEAQATRENRQRLKRRGMVCIEPGIGDTACGDQGQGRLADLETIYLQGLKALSSQDMAGVKVLVALGPTREPWDGVRFWSNPSSGLMGASLAVSAWLRGAEVSAVCGPTAIWLPHGIHRMDVSTAKEMYAACLDLWPSQEIACLAAAVSDFSPKPRSGGKFKKSQAKKGGLRIEFEQTPDILSTLGGLKTKKQRLIGFAAETENLQENAKEKLSAKNLDLVVANNVAKAESGFKVPTNQVLVMDNKGRGEEWPLLQKTEVAWRIWDWTLQLYT